MAASPSGSCSPQGTSRSHCARGVAGVEPAQPAKPPGAAKALGAAPFGLRPQPPDTPPRTNNLDPVSRERVLDALHNYAGAVVLVTHDPGAVQALHPERVILLPGRHRGSLERGLPRFGAACLTSTPLLTQSG